METNQIVFRRWEDVVFENRNKLYGAYLLRKTYANHLLTGLGITVFVVSVILLLHAGDENSRIAERILPPLMGESVIRVQPPPVFQKPVLPMERPRATRASGPVVVTRSDVEEEEEFVPVVDLFPRMAQEPVTLLLLKVMAFSRYHNRSHRSSQAC